MTLKIVSAIHHDHDHDGSLILCNEYCSSCTTMTMMPLTLLLSTLLLLSSIVPQTSAFQVASFSPPASATIRRSRSKSLLLAKKKNDDEPLDLKQELTAYLAMRKEVGADEAMKT